MTNLSKDVNTNSNPSGRRRPARWLIAVPALALCGAFATTALARGDGWRDGSAHAADGDARHQKRLEKMLAHVDATPAQQTQIKALVENNKGDWKAMHEQRRQLHDEMRTALTAATIDPAEVEATRSKMVAQMEASSRRFASLAVQVGQILTHEQRKLLAEHMAHRHVGPMGF